MLLPFGVHFKKIIYGSVIILFCCTFQNGTTSGDDSVQGADNPMYLAKDRSNDPSSNDAMELEDKGASET